MTAPPPKPTLWRTCRVLANRTRLRILGLLIFHSPQTVSAVAARLNLPMPVASLGLRSLEARGLLTVRRVKLHAHYRLNDIPTGDARDLVAALKSAFRSELSPENLIFRLSTAFTHPRRVEIFRLLQTQPCAAARLRIATGISGPALVRHLEKLKARGFVVSQKNIYSTTKPRQAFGHTLAQMAAQ